MKRIKNVLVAVGILVSVSSAQASEGGLIEVNNHSTSGHSIISVINKDFNYSNMNLFCNTSGESFLRESISAKPSIQKLVDLNELDNGNYTIELSGKNGSVQKEFKVQYGQIHIEANEDVFEEARNMKFLFDEEKNNLIVSYINPNKNDLTIKLENTDWNEDFEVIEAGNKLGYSGVFNLNKLRKGNYRATLISGDRSYHYDFYR
ncbi:MAG: hypothetical protein N4A71_14630 [Carboxylicivirga sp.]|jgi:hypothetical protein|nr:hypothetical protein [Carboxylicivirga sp.]